MVAEENLSELGEFEVICLRLPIQIYIFEGISQIWLCTVCLARDGNVYM